MADLTGNPAATLDLVMPDINVDGTTPASPAEMNSRYQQLLDNDARMVADAESGDALGVAAVKASHAAMFQMFTSAMAVYALRWRGTDAVHESSPWPAGWDVTRESVGYYRVDHPLTATIDEMVTLPVAGFNSAAGSARVASLSGIGPNSLYFTTKDTLTQEAIDTTVSVLVIVL